jgi:hypothetical protein
MINNSKLVEMLWAEFHTDFQANKRVYFNFSGDLLTKIFKKNNYSQLNPIEVINQSCRELYNLNTINFVTLKDHALRPCYKRFSCAILLACQQILVVEEMYTEEFFSKDSYFERLRQAISPEMVIKKQNPFKRGSDFEKIWLQLRSEILEIAQDEDLITFNKGNGPKNLYRNYPLSQSLLTKMDILIAREIVGKDKLEYLDRLVILKELQENLHKFPSRAKIILQDSDLKHKAIDQILFYREMVVKDQLQNLKKPSSELKQNNYELKVFKYTKNKEMFFGIKVFNHKTKKYSSNTVFLEKFLSYLKEKEFLILKCLENNSEIGWTEQKSILKDNDDLVMISHKDFHLSSLRGLKEFIKLKKVEAISSIENLEDIKILEIKEFNLKCDSTILRKGHLFVKNSKILAEDSIKWLGGVAADKNSNLFLKDYLPNALEFDSEIYGLDMSIKANSIMHNLNDFMVSLKDEIVDTKYLIEFLDGQFRNESILLYIATKKPKPDVKESFAFKVNRSGDIACVPEQVSEVDTYIENFTCSINRNFIKFDHQDIYNLMLNKDLIELSTCDEDLVDESIFDPHLSRGLKKVLINYIKSIKKLPFSTIRHM